MNIDPVFSYGSSFYVPLVRNNSTANSQTAKSISRLSSGLRIQTAADAPADLAQSERLRSMISRYDAAISNTENGSSYISTADSYLQSISDITGRMQELAISANDGTKTDTDRAALQAEFGQLQETITSITSGKSPLASFNGSPIFQGETKSIATGPEYGQATQIPAADLSISSTETVGTDSQSNPITWGVILSPGESGTNISSQSAAGAAIEKLSAAVDYLSTTRARFGATQAGLKSNIEGMQNAEMNSIARESGIRDLDYAKETVNLVKFLSLGQISRKLISNTTGNLLGTG